MLTWIVFFVLTTPFCFWAAFSDLKFMKIPNLLSLGLALVFVISGLFLLPFDEYLWRLFVGLMAFLIGFVIYATGSIGGGDIKFIAASLPYVATDDLLSYAFLVAILTLAGVAAHRLIGRLKLAPEDWQSWRNERKFPLGFSLAGALIYYMAFKIATFI